MLIATVLASGTSLAVAEEKNLDRPVLLTGQAEEGYLPFLFPLGSPRRGIYFDIAHRITEITGIEIKWGIYPATRGRYLFERCHLQLEFGVSPSWYTEEEHANSQFYEPFMKHMDMIAYAGADQGLDHIPLEGEPVLAVLGYRYPTFDFAERLDVGSERTMINMLEQGRAKAGILERTVGQFLANDMGAEIHFAQVVQSTDLTLRVHSCAAEHLPSLNAAILELKSSGEIDRIMASYLNPMN
ncbi:MAG: ABC transporter substrate-binding protein [Roseibium sp.]|nr:ABC transporter substrate-binding protein [Roseibium sp.]